MAQIIDVDGDETINVDDVVGVRGVNSMSDVMVVQALLNFCTQFTFKWASVTAPEPNGSLDKNTQKLIFDYQEMVRRRSARQGGFWVAKDGRVASFKEGVKLLYKQDWTILSLNSDCGVLAAALALGTNHVNAICMRWPFTVGIALGRFPFL